MGGGDGGGGGLADLAQQFGSLDTGIVIGPGVVPSVSLHVPSNEP